MMEPKDDNLTRRILTSITSDKDWSLSVQSQSEEKIREKWLLITEED